MNTQRLRPTLNRFAPAVPLLMGLAACGLSALMLSSCGRDEPLIENRTQPLRLEGVPTIRVRLTHQPVKEATLWTTGGYRVLVDGQELGQSAGRLKRTPCTRTEGQYHFGRLNTPGQRLELHPVGEGLVGVGETLYRGYVVLVAGGGPRFYVHNHVDMESYVASVIAKELYGSWHIETFKAQAVSARTYALHEIATRGRDGTFDVWDSVRSQVYGGMSAETDKSWQAVRDTHGWVLVHGPVGQEQVFSAMFSACNGGYVNGAHVVQPVARIIPPLAGGQADPDGASCPRWTWEPVTISKENLYRALVEKYPNLDKLGGVETILVRQETDYGRPVWLDIVGVNGERSSLRAETLRHVLLGADVPMQGTLYSMNCKLRDTGEAIQFYDGRGYGHGVGMSQWGAQDKAKRGLTAEEILEFYYPSSKIMRAW